MARQPAKKHLNVYVVAMYIVQVYHVRVYLIQSPEQPCRITLRIEAHSIKQARHSAVQIYLGLRCAALHVRIHRIVAPSPKGIRVHAMLKQPGMQFTHNGTSRAIVEAVYLHIAQRSSQVFSQRKRFINQSIRCRPARFTH